MQWGHELIIRIIEVSYPAFKEFNEFQRWKFHKKMLNTPFFVMIAYLILPISNLSINIAAQLQHKLNYTHKLIFKFEEFFIAFFLCLQLKTACFKFSIFLVFKYTHNSLYVFLIGRKCIFCEALKKVEHEIESIMIYFL